MSKPTTTSAPELTDKQASAALAANRLGFVNHVIGVTGDGEKAASLLKQATDRLDRRNQLATTILENLKG